MSISLAPLYPPPQIFPSWEYQFSCLSIQQGPCDGVEFNLRAAFGEGKRGLAFLRVNNRQMISSMDSFSQRGYLFKNALCPQGPCYPQAKQKYRG